MSGRSSTGFAPGKLLLSGEHAVVHGHPAVAVAISLGTTVTLTQVDGARTLSAPFSDSRLDAALSAVLPDRGLHVAIQSNLPIGRGMGSSAALAIALLRAREGLNGKEASFDLLHEEGFKVEAIFHGQPSGVDHAVSALGGAVAYRKGEGAPIIDPFSPPPLKLVVLDSGTPGDTAKMVASVAARRPAIDPVLRTIGALTGEIISMLQRGTGGPALGDALTENHRLLCRIGVSTDQLDGLVDLALSAGAHGAKLAGAGGGGVVLALTDDADTLLDTATAAKVQAFAVGLHPRAKDSQTQPTRTQG